MNRSSHVRHTTRQTQAATTLRAARTLALRSRQDASDPDVTCEVDIIHLGAVKEARAALPDDIGLTHVAELLSLLSSATRLKILLALQPRARGTPRELCVCDLATVIGASKSLTSHQLRLLRESALVQVRRAGKLAYYRLADGVATGLLDNVLTMALRRVRSGYPRAGAR